MADVNEMFNETTKEESFFVPGKEKKKGLSQPIAKGEYFGHIIQCELKLGFILILFKHQKKMNQKRSNLRALLVKWKIPVENHTLVISSGELCGDS